MNFNKVFYGGNLARDPETKALPSGQTVTEFTIASNKSWMDKEGNKKEKTHFVDCQAWGKTGESIKQYFSKGQPIFIVGELQTRSWEKDGVKQYKTEISVNEFQFVGEKKNTPSQPAKPSQSYDYPEEDINPEDIPF